MTVCKLFCLENVAAKPSLAEGIHESGDCMSEIWQDAEHHPIHSRSDEKKKKRGQLKIFLGYAMGVGKTYAMLKAAHAMQQRGVDTVIGYINPHNNPKTLELQKGFEVLPKLELPCHGEICDEFDIDAALNRKPDLILIDDMAHTNVAPCRHTKRYKDIEELLNMGIDVYTTINIQHIESLNDTIALITGSVEHERIPDSVFDQADQVAFVDIEPQDLIERLKEDTYYQAQEDIQKAQAYYTKNKFMALREIALRRCADRINLLADEKQRRYYTEEHILVCLSSSPSNAKIIRTAARMATAFHGGFTAIYIETSYFCKMDEADQKRLRANIQLAQQLGANIEVVYGDDIPFQISEFARLSGVTKIVIGRNSVAKNFLFRKPSLTEHLIANAPNLDIHIIPDMETSTMVYRKKKKNHKTNIVFSMHDIIRSSGIIALASGIGILFHKLYFAESNIIMVYVLAVLVISMITKNQIYSLIASIVSVLVFNFLFTDPQFTLHAYSQGYPITFAMMFGVSFLTGSLAVRLKNHARSLAQSAFRTKVLFDTNRLLQKVTKQEDIISITAQQLMKLLDKNIVFYPIKNDVLDEPLLFLISKDCEREYYLSEKEREVAQWVLQNNKHAGASTQTLSDARCLYLAVRINEVVYGVIGIAIEKEPLDAFDNSILLSILGECALSLENEKHAREKEEAAILAKNEKLRANLLRSISHDLRTPLTSISGNASNLFYHSESFDEATKKQLYLDIYDDSIWLINLVENLLSITKLEEGRLNLKITDDLMDDVITEALRHINRKSIFHHIEVQNENEFLLAKMDARLIVQVIINIVDNAIKYTQKGSNIVISTKKQGDRAVVSIADDGPGLSDEMKERIFDMFYTGNNQIADSRRSLGLGLSLCKSIIHAHNGEIMVSDNVPHGTIFTFTLPAGEVYLYE